MKLAHSILGVFFTMLIGLGQFSFVKSVGNSGGNELKNECQAFVERYEELIDMISDPARPLGEKQDLIEHSSKAFFLTDSTLLFDDLYLHDQGGQYLPCHQYLITLISWYPNGAKIDFSGLTFGHFYIHNEGKYIQANIQVSRFLEGLDFLDVLQIDTSRLEFHLHFDFYHRNGEWVLKSPKLISITPVYKNDLSFVDSLAFIEMDLVGNPSISFPIENDQDSIDGEQMEIEAKTLLAPKKIYRRRGRKPHKKRVKKGEIEPWEKWLIKEESHGN